MSFHNTKKYTNCLIKSAEAAILTNNFAGLEVYEVLISHLDSQSMKGKGLEVRVDVHLCVKVFEVNLTQCNKAVFALFKSFPCFMKPGLTIPWVLDTLGFSNLTIT